MYESIQLYKVRSVLIRILKLPLDKTKNDIMCDTKNNQSSFVKLSQSWTRGEYTYMNSGVLTHKYQVTYVPGSV